MSVVPRAVGVRADMIADELAADLRQSLAVRGIAEVIALTEAQASQAIADRAGLRTAMDRVLAVTLRAGGGTGFGPLAEIHDIAFEALSSTSTHEESDA